MYFKLPEANKGLLEMCSWWRDISSYHCGIRELFSWWDRGRPKCVAVLKILAQYIVAYKTRMSLCV